jgi:hypothetical protein
MALSAAGGIRPGVHAGWKRRQYANLSGKRMSAPFTGLLLGADSGGAAIGLKPIAARRPVNGPLPKKTIKQIIATLHPGVNAGSNTAYGGKGRKRPSGITLVFGNCQIIQRPSGNALVFAIAKFYRSFFAPHAILPAWKPKQKNEFNIIDFQIP